MGDLRPRCGQEEILSGHSSQPCWAQGKPEGMSPRPVLSAPRGAGALRQKRRFEGNQTGEETK